MVEKVTNDKVHILKKVYIHHQNNHIEESGINIIISNFYLKIKFKKTLDSKAELLV
jgi:hypothetical protein